LEQIKLLFRSGRFEERPEIAHVVPLLRRQSHRDWIRLVLRLLGLISVWNLDSRTVQISVVLPIDGLGLHLVINGDVPPNGLLIIIELHLDLVRSQEFCSFPRVHII